MEGLEVDRALSLRARQLSNRRPGSIPGRLHLSESPLNHLTMKIEIKIEPNRQGLPVVYFDGKEQTDTLDAVSEILTFLEKPRSYIAELVGKSPRTTERYFMTGKFPAEVLVALKAELEKEVAA